METSVLRICYIFSMIRCLFLVMWLRIAPSTNSGAQSLVHSIEHSTLHLLRTFSFYSYIYFLKYSHSLYKRAQPLLLFPRLRSHQPTDFKFYLIQIYLYSRSPSTSLKPTHSLITLTHPLPTFLAPPFQTNPRHQRWVPSRKSTCRPPSPSHRAWTPSAR